MVPPTGKLSPLKLDYSVMQHAVLLAHERMVGSVWTLENVRTYLRVRYTVVSVVVLLHRTILQLPNRRVLREGECIGMSRLLYT